jgi:hypothetical protein
MKKILSILFLIYSITTLYSQITQIELRKCEKIGYITQGAYDILNEKCSDGNYRFSFRDFGYTRITVGRSFEFKDIDGSYDKLFEAIVKGFDNVKQDLAFDLPKQFLVIRYMNSLGIKGVSFTIMDKPDGSVGKSNYFTKNQMYKLFGKSKE